jgi:LacI family transcriptional regulator/LacI family repressor for deo operon, udp, cdd, tsx, nupC, and nupG
VKGATRDRVLASIELLNYRPTQLAPRAAAARRHKTIALVVKELDNPYYAEIIGGARGVADARGYILLVVSSEGDYDAERRAIELLRARDVDGMMVTPVLDEHADLSHFFELKRRNIPFVLLEQVLGVPASLVDIDNVEASRRAAEYLIGLGHTRLAHFAGPSYSMHSMERVHGVRRAASASRLIFGDDDVVPAGAHLESGYEAALVFFRGRAAEDRPTAVTCYNDLVAVGVCRALRELGIDVPGDVSVVGCDDIPLVEYLAVPLTTVQVPKTEMGRIAAELLIGQIESREAVAPQKVYLESTLVVRASTRPLGGAVVVAPPHEPRAAVARPR